MDFVTLTIDLLKILSNLFGSYGLAIVVLTLAVRIAMWPLGVSQQKSMRKMQELSPKLKEIQNRYKSNPQMMQMKMMEFYKEHQFNPFGGCFPMLIQLPIFILLYSALISPQFIDVAGKSHFLFINRLDATLQSRSGEHGDGKFAVEKGDVFELNKTATVYLSDKGVIQDVKFENAKKDLKIQGDDIEPGQPIDMKIQMDSLDLPFEKLDKVSKIETSVFNMKTKELENLTFERKDALLIANVKTEEITKKFNVDVLVLVLFFGVTMFISQKLMTVSNANLSADPAQKMMQEQMSKMMPVMITAMFVFLPIPAGVLLYMVISNLFQMAQSYIVNKQMDMEKGKTKVSSNTILNAKPVEVKEIKDK